MAPQVFASVLRPSDGSSVLSNRFAYSFCLDPVFGEAGGAVGPAVGLPQRPPRVHPAHTSEAMRQLEVLAASEQVPDWGN